MLCARFFVGTLICWFSVLIERPALLLLCCCYAVESSCDDTSKAVVCLQELLQAGPAGIHTAVARLLEGVEQKKRDGLGRTLSMARLSSRLSNGQSVNLSTCASHEGAYPTLASYACLLAYNNAVIRGVAGIPHCGPGLIELACISRIKCWSQSRSWAGMHFIHQVLDPLIKCVTVACVQAS